LDAIHNSRALYNHGAFEVHTDTKLKILDLDRILTGGPIDKETKVKQAEANLFTCITNVQGTELGQKKAS
jgi:hypothetical protein